MSSSDAIPDISRCQSMDHGGSRYHVGIIDQTDVSLTLVAFDVGIRVLEEPWTAILGIFSCHRLRRSLGNPS